MKTDLLLIPMGARWPDLRAAAPAAEASGFDGLWTWDHLRDPVGGFGPRMAAIAGRHGDGFNTQAFHPQLADLVGRARDAHAAAGRDAARFIVSVFAGLDDRWLRAESKARQMLDRVGVDRLILL